MLSWEEYTNGSSKYTVSATNNITGETIIQKHGTTAPESVTSQDTKFKQDTEDANSKHPPKKPLIDTAPQTPDESESDESDSEDDVYEPSMSRNNTLILSIAISHAHRAIYHSLGTRNIWAQARALLNIVNARTDS